MENNLSFDLHGFLLEEVDQIFDNKIYFAKLNNISQFKFITGTSKIQNKIIDLCVNIYKFEYYIPMHNPGEIVVIIE